MITTTSALLFATVALNALSGIAAPIRVTRATAEAHQIGRRHPQPNAADDLLKARTPPAPSTPPVPVAIHRRFPRRVYYEQYAREVAQDETLVAARAPEAPSSGSDTVEARSSPAKARGVHRRHHQKGPKKPMKKRSSPSTKNLAQRRSSKVGGTLSKRSKPDADLSKRSSPAPQKRTDAKPKSIKKRSTKTSSSPAKKRRSPAGTSLTKKSERSGATKPVAKRSKRSNTKNTKRATKAKNVKRSNKNKNLKKRAPTTPNKVALRNLDVPSKNLEARHYKIIKVSSKKGCKHTEQAPANQECPCNCSCACNKGCQGAGSPAPAIPPVSTPPTGNSTVPADPAGGATPPIVAPPAPAVPSSSSVPSAAPSSKPNVPAAGAPAVPSANPELAPTGIPAVPAKSVGRRSNKALKNRSPRISPARSQRRTSRSVRK